MKKSAFFHFTTTTILIFSFVSSGYGSYISYVDPVTGFGWEDPAYNAFIGHNTLDYFNNNNLLDPSNSVHLATYQELVQLFSDIGPYTPTINAFFGNNLPGVKMTYGSYNAGNGYFGDAMGHYDLYDTLVTYPWYIGAPHSWLNTQDTGAWIVHYPAPEPTTMILFGTGLAGLAAVGRRKRD